MRLKALLLIILLFDHHKIAKSDGFWSLDWLTNPFARLFSKSGEDNAQVEVYGVNKTAANTLSDNGNAGNGIKRAANSDESNFWESSPIPAHCEESILLPLARLKIVSPEKIIELITSNDLEQTCYRVGTTVTQVKKAIENCAGFPPDHLYQKLADGLEQFDGIVCADVSKEGATPRRSSKKRLVDYKECLSQLQDEFYDCEGPADWFEKRNASIACQFYNDIIDCNYVKAAMLCGKSAARIVRDFSDAIMRKVLTFRCKKSRAIPHVDSPMIDKSNRNIELSKGVLFFSFVLIYFVT